MRIALILPAEGPKWGSIRSPNLGNRMICAGTRRVMERVAPGKIQIEEFTYLKRPTAEEIARINQCAQAIFVGTNLFQPHALGWEWLPEDWEQIRIPYWFYGVGYSGPLQGEDEDVYPDVRALIHWASWAQGVGVRDPETGRWLSRHGIRVELTGCPVLGFPDEFPGVLPGSGLPVLAVRRLLLHTSSAEVAAAQRTMIEWFFKEHPDGVCVVQEEADLELLAGRPVVSDWDGIIQVLAEARFVLAARLHAGMVALALGRPAVFLAHDTRVGSFCEMVGLPKRRLGFTDLRAAIHAVNRIEDGDLSEFTEPCKVIPVFREYLESFMARILQGSPLPSDKKGSQAARKTVQDLVDRNARTDLHYHALEETAVPQRLDTKPAGTDNARPITTVAPLMPPVSEWRQLLQRIRSLVRPIRYVVKQFRNPLLAGKAKWQRWHRRFRRAGQLIAKGEWRLLFQQTRELIRPRRLATGIQLPREPSLPQAWERSNTAHRKVRVLVIVPAMSAGGMERCTAVLLKYWNRTEFEVGLVEIFDRPAFYTVPGDVPRFCVQNFAWRKAKSLRPRVAAELSSEYDQDLAWMNVTAQRMAAVVGALDPDVVLAQDYFVSILALMAKPFLKTHPAILCSAHIQYSAFLPILDKARLYDGLIRSYFNDADRIITVSEGIRADLVEHFGVDPELATVIHNPLDLEEIQRLADEPIPEELLLGSGTPFLLFVGRLTAQKGLSYLVRAMALATNVEQFRLVLVGDGDEEPRLRALVTELDLDDTVLFLGRQSNPFKFMRKAAGFVLPSVAEGMPYVVMEAMACGCPVIVTDSVPGVRELVGERGIIVPPRDPAVLAEAMLKLLWNSTLQEQMREAGLARSRAFDAKQAVLEYERLVRHHARIAQ